MTRRVYEDLDEGRSAGLIPAALTLLIVALVMLGPLALMGLIVHSIGGLGPRD